MHIVILKFLDKSRAPALMEEHKAWIRSGFEDGTFVMTGTLAPPTGGAVLAHGLTRAELDARVAIDPFVAQGVVEPDIIEIVPGRADDRLAFLMG